MTWDQFGKSLFKIFGVFIIINLQLSNGISFCSKSFRFDQLCPDPRFASRSPGVLTNHQPFTTIDLQNLSRRLQNGGSSYGSVSAILDPSTTSCNFHRNGMESAIVTGVHISDKPFDFRHSTQCTNIVRFQHDLYDTDQPGQIYVSRSTSRDKKLCSNELGIRRLLTSEDMTGKDVKSLIYLWHNFTLFPHSAQFVDTISNFHLAKEELLCANQKTQQFAQVAVVVNRSNRCELIVQQYKIEEKRSPYGCTDTHPNPFPVQFCGVYECGQINSILTGLKLRRRAEEGEWNRKKSYEGITEPYDYEIPKPGPVTQMTTVSTDEEEEGVEIEEPMDWKEVAFLSAFPMCGIFFILIVLNILRSRSAREICRGYPYPRPTQHGSIPSSLNYEKNYRPSM